MHGVSRESRRNRSAEELAKLAAKKEKYAKLNETLFGLRRLGLLSTDSLELTGAMCRVNPDCYTAWNYRRQILHALSGSEESFAWGLWPMAADTITGELQLTQEALKRQPKSYCAWYHRRWVLSRLDEGTARGEVFAKELELCARFLDLDERNFHCWTYRRWVAGQAGVSAEEDLAFCQHRLDVNFSNYSAFHQRSKVLLLLEEYNQEPLHVLTGELQLVADITVTEPDDQSAWWYYQFLLQQLQDCAARSAITEEQKKEVLKGEEEKLKELIEMEPETKWGRVLLAKVLTMAGGTSLSEAKDTYEWLVANDADRACFWRSNLAALPS